MLSGATGNLDKATWTVQDCQAEPMQLRDCGDQAQSKAHSCRMAAPVRTVEALEYGLPFRSPDPGTRVLHLNHGSLGTLQQAQRHGTTRGGELDCVVNQVGHRLEKQVAIACDNAGFARIEAQGHTLVLGDRMIKLMHRL